MSNWAEAQYVIDEIKKELAKNTPPLYNSDRLTTFFINTYADGIDTNEAYGRGEIYIPVRFIKRVYKAIIAPFRSNWHGSASVDTYFIPVTNDDFSKGYYSNSKELRRNSITLANRKVDGDNVSTVPDEGYDITNIEGYQKDSANSDYYLVVISSREYQHGAASSSTSRNAGFKLYLNGWD